MDSEWLIVAMFFYVAFLLSTVCHEAAHALAARWVGDETGYANRTISLNPYEHFVHEPFGFGFLPLVSLCLNLTGVGFGVIGFAGAPFDPYFADRHPRKAALMAMAGPAMNFLLSLGAFGLLKAGLIAGWFQTATEPKMYQMVRGNGDLTDLIAVFLGVMAFENLLLTFWNLIPIPPMDGFSVALFFIEIERVPKFLALRSQIGMFFPMAIFAAGRIFSEGFFPFAGNLVRWVF